MFASCSCRASYHENLWIKALTNDGAFEAKPSVKAAIVQFENLHKDLPKNVWEALSFRMERGLTQQEQAASTQAVIRHRDTMNATIGSGAELVSPV